MAKQNKFTKSVMERLMETEKKDIAAEIVVLTELKKEKTEKSKEEITPAKSVKKTEPVTESRGDVIPDISDFLSKTPERIAKNKTFYLDTDVIERLKLVAKKSKTTDSKLCNDILRKVLKLDES